MQRQSVSAWGRHAAASCVLLLAACGSEPAPVAQAPDNDRLRVISGEVGYRERIALPPGAEVVVTLEDQSRADAPAVILTDYTHVVGDDNRQQPFPFRLVYHPSAIDERMRYGLRARIVHDGELLFTSTEHIDPFAGKPGEPVVIRVVAQ